MISGFNTDIEFDGTVYHVQTEDKGAPSREIMSLIYDRGTILASKRVNYHDLAALNYDEKQLQERLGRQHKLICAAVRAGRLSELKEMTAKGSGRSNARAGKTSVDDRTVGPAPSSAPVPSPLSIPADRAPVVDGSRSTPGQPLNISFADVPIIAEVIPDPVQPEPVVEVMRVIEEEILPVEAVEIVSELAGKERPSNQKLKLELLGNSKFKGGDRQTLTLMICRGTERKVVPGAQIMVKILGSAFRPVIFHAKSDSNGLAKIHLQVPQFSAGRAALLVRAVADGQEVELRRIVTSG